MSSQLECPKCQTIFLVDLSNKNDFAICPRCENSLSMFDIRVMPPEVENTGEFSIELSMDSRSHEAYTDEDLALSSQDQTNILVDAELPSEIESFDQRMRNRSKKNSKIAPSADSLEKSVWNDDILKTGDFNHHSTATFALSEELSFSELDESFENEHSLEIENSFEAPVMLHELESQFNKNQQVYLKQNNLFSEFSAEAFDNIDRAFEGFSGQETSVENLATDSSIASPETDLFSLARSSDFDASQKYRIPKSPKAPLIRETENARRAHLSISDPVKHLVSLPLEATKQTGIPENFDLNKSGEHLLLTDKIQVAKGQETSIPSLWSLFSFPKVIFVCSFIFIFASVLGYFLLAPPEPEATPQRIADKHFSLANHFYADQRFDDALAEYQKALSTLPTLYKAQKSMASVYIKLGQAQKAKNAYQKLIKIHPEDEDRKRIQEIIKDAHFLKDHS